MSIKDTRIQTRCGTTHGIQDAPSRPVVIVVTPDPDAIRLRPKTPGWVERVAKAGLIGVLLLIGLCFVQAATQKIAWIGRTNLAVVFEVVDDTGTPIAGATIQIHSDGGRYKGSAVEDFVLTTDGNGIAGRWCRDIACHGTSYGIFREQRAVHLPYWTYRASTAGYAPSEDVSMPSTEHHQMVKQRKGHDVLTIPLTLRKLPPP